MNQKIPFHTTHLTSMSWCRRPMTISLHRRRAKLSVQLTLLPTQIVGLWIQSHRRRFTPNVQLHRTWYHLRKRPATCRRHRWHGHPMAPVLPRQLLLQETCATELSFPVWLFRAVLSVCVMATLLWLMTAIMLALWMIVALLIVKPTQQRVFQTTQLSAMQLEAVSARFLHAAVIYPGQFGDNFAV